jgi:hypothetical protein
VFVVWNALGGITWAFSMVLLGYYVGAAAKSLMNDVGSVGMVVIILSIVAFVITRKVLKRRRAKAAGAAGAAAPLAVEVAGTNEAVPFGGQPTVATPTVSTPAQPTVGASVIPGGQATVASVVPALSQPTVARARPGADEGARRE